MRCRDRARFTPSELISSSKTLLRSDLIDTDVLDLQELFDAML